MKQLIPEQVFGCSPGKPLREWQPEDAITFANNCVYEFCRVNGLTAEAAEQRQAVARVVENHHGGNITEWINPQQAETLPLGTLLYTTPPTPPAGVPDGFDLLIHDALAEAGKAMTKFPQPNYTLVKIGEEFGEVIKAAVHFAEGRDTAEHVRDEMKQAIAMLYRLWIEGDQVNGVPAISLSLSAAPQPAAQTQESKEPGK